MTRAAWSTDDKLSTWRRLSPGPAGPQSLRCHSPAAKLFCQARVLETGTRCELVTVTLHDGVSCQQLFAERGMTLSFVAGDAGINVAEAGGDIMTKPLGTKARPQSSSHHQENNLFVSRHPSGEGCKSELFTTLLLPLPTFT